MTIYLIKYNNQSLVLSMQDRYEPNYINHIKNPIFFFKNRQSTFFFTINLKKVHNNIRETEVHIIQELKITDHTTDTTNKLTLCIIPKW